jgi:predicted Rossmann fold flavoprotein
MIFKKELKNVPVLLGYSLCDLKKENDDFLIFTNKGTLKAHKVVIATGGISYQKIGATDIAFEIAKKFSHNIITPKPALVGFTVQKNEFWFKELSGISFKVRMKTGKKSFLDDLLFAHRGISAPAVLNSSLYWDKGSIEIDFLPDISLKSILKNQNRQISSLLPLPKRFTKAFLQSIDLEDKKASLLTKEDREKLSLLKNYTFSPAGTFGYSKAEVTKGGIDTDEIDPDSMMSRYQKNLFFIGECLNVTGELGGYNLQWAFSSAFGLRI